MKKLLIVFLLLLANSSIKSGNRDAIYPSSHGPHEWKKALLEKNTQLLSKLSPETRRRQEGILMKIRIEVEREALAEVEKLEEEVMAGFSLEELRRKIENEACPVRRYKFGKEIKRRDLEEREKKRKDLEEEIDRLKSCIAMISDKI